MHSAPPSPHHVSIARQVAIGSINRFAVVCLFGAAVAGCRTGRTSRSMVQVTADPEAIVADVDAPPQRLAINQQGVESTEKRVSENSGSTNKAAAFELAKALQTVNGSKPTAPQARGESRVKTNPSGKTIHSGKTCGSDSIERHRFEIRASEQACTCERARYDASIAAVG